MIELRCLAHLHGKVDPGDVSIHVKCGWCSRKRRVAVFHRWTLAQITEAQARGLTTVRPCIDEAHAS